MSRAPTRKFIKTIQDFKDWAKVRHGWLGKPQKAAVRMSSHSYSLALKLECKGNEETWWDRSSWNASQFSFLLSFTVITQLPRTCLRECPPSKAPTERREAGEAKAAEMVFVDLNFPVSHLTFQRLHHFPTLAVILLKNSNIHLVSLPTSSHSQLDPFSPSLLPFVIKKQNIDIAYSMVSKVSTAWYLSEDLPSSLPLTFTRFSSLCFSIWEGKWS